MFGRRDKTCSRVEKAWFLFVHWVAKNSKTNEKIQKQSCREVFCKKGVVKNIAKLTGKHLRWSLFLTELQV